MDRLLKEILACPVCKNSDLEFVGDEKIVCEKCNEEYQVKNSIPIMLPKEESKNSYRRGVKLLKGFHKREGKYGMTSWSDQIVKLIPKGDGIALDFGCGEGEKRVVENFGYKYVGLDIAEGKSVSIIGDGHKLPFSDECFSLVTSIAVMEHLKDPWKGTLEISRVLKNGGIFVGSCNFLYPFHSDSYFHMTHLGLTKILKDSNFSLISLEPLERNGFEELINDLFKFKPFTLIAGILTKSALKMRQIVGKVIIKKVLYDPEKVKRGWEFLEQEKYRYASGFVFCAKK